MKICTSVEMDRVEKSESVEGSGEVRKSKRIAKNTDKASKDVFGKKTVCTSVQVIRGDTGESTKYQVGSESQTQLLTLL